MLTKEQKLIKWKCDNSKKYNNFYDYSLVTSYENTKTKIKIICPKHGVFEQTFIQHNIKGCKKCGYERQKNVTKIRWKDDKNHEQYIKRSKQIHGDKYDYSLVGFTKINERIKIICPKHGIFEQVADSHLGGHGCAKCAREKNVTANNDKQQWCKDNFIKRARYIFPDYDYSRAEYISATSKVEVGCPIHGFFVVEPNNHINHGYKPTGCPKCYPKSSHTENELYDYVCSLVGSENVIQSYRKLISPKEIDICVPSHNLAIEFNGIYYHSSTKTNDKKTAYRHLHKTEAVEQLNYQLLHVFENEWKTHKEIWKSIIAYKLKKCSNKIYARHCSIKQLSHSEAFEFFVNNHIQQYVNSKIKYGLVYQNRLVAAITFGKSRYNKRYEYELYRFANSLNTCVIGGFSKLLNHFIKIHNPSSICSYANRRWSVGTLYEKNKFTFVKNTDPNMFLVKNNLSTKLYSRLLFQKHKLKYKFKNYDSSLSAIQNCLNNNYRCIWDSGNKLYELILKEENHD